MERKDILEKLAANEITRSQAEEMLSALGEPVPERIPEPPPQATRGRNTGCLVAAIVAFILAILIGLVLVGGLFFVRAASHTGTQQAVPVRATSGSSFQQQPEVRIIDGQAVMEIDGTRIELTPKNLTPQGETP